MDRHLRRALLSKAHSTSTMALNMAALLITSSVINGLMMILTLFRLLFRLQIQRFWWEDMWAAVMFVCGMTFIIAQLVYFETVNYGTALITRWMTSVAFTSTVWAARTSLLYSIIRVIFISPSTVLRKFTHVMTALFFMFWAIIIALKTRRCVNNTEPILSLGSVRPTCALQEVETLFEVITDCVSDVALIVLGLKLLWKVKLPRRQRRMILCVSSSSAILSMFSLLHATCRLIPVESGKHIASEMKLTSALIVCNLLVVVTYMYRMIFGSPNGSFPSESESSSEDDDFTTRVPPNPTTQLLTTVDLSVTLGANTVATNGDLTSGILSSSRRGSAA
ncbi:hypothetical protein HD554DRAFT_2059157 [Boletus coccyginus]|nr:hypothetical protein HD554DRAFT_2059157 [Boletus coccyginus]